MTTQTIERTGRPSKLTPERTAKLCQYVAEGNYITTACQAVGIHFQTLQNWLQRADEEAKNGGGEYFDFFEALKNAEATAEAERVSRIRLAGIGGQVVKRITREKRDGTIETEESISPPQWLADMTHLERRHPDRWGRRDRTRVDINETKTVTITHVEVVLNEAGRTPAIEGESRELPAYPPKEIIDKIKQDDERYKA